jgi:DNA-binding NarL/FixJ family response regulator
MKTLTQRNRNSRTSARLDERTLSPTVDTTSVRAAVGAVSHLFAKTDIRYWRRRLIHCAYGEMARPRPFREFSARIEHEGVGFFFPLDTGAEEEAAVRALEIYRAVLEAGWPSAFRHYPREFTLALFLAENPMIFTYTTLYTATDASIDSKPPRLRPVNRHPRVSVAIIEGEDGCRWALAKWIRSLPEYSCRAVFSTGTEALLALKRRPVNLVLFNRQLPDVAAGEFLETLQSSAPCVPAIGYRIYDTSDEMFFAQPGVSEGFYFRRRPPDLVLEPVRGVWQKGPPTPTEWLARIHAYVQRLFLFPPTRKEVQDSSALTPREHDILNCLRKGSPDKDIARDLSISAWTVHTHLKKIYEKLGVRSRTEAVVKYLQK